MAEDRILELVGRPGGPLADAAVWTFEVAACGPLTPSIERLVITAPGLEDFPYKAGQDLMLRVPLDDERIINRRYTIRTLDRSIPAVTIDVSLHGTGPGTEWVRAAKVGSRIDAIGPRGKITLRDEADWHLFVTDETGLPGALAMLEALPGGAKATGIFEVDSPADEQESAITAKCAIRFLHRNERSAPGDPALFRDAVSDLELPNGIGHVYVAAEAHVVREIQKALSAKGLQADQISAKAYWRRDRANADRGEPDSGD